MATEEYTILKNVLTEKFPSDLIAEQRTSDSIPTFWVTDTSISSVLLFLKVNTSVSFPTLHDLTAIDERERVNRHEQPASDFTIVYHLCSYTPCRDLRIKVALTGSNPAIESITNIYVNANWYEREVFDMFGITFKNHPRLQRILMPDYWKGHPLRKEHPARATEMPHFTLAEEAEDEVLARMKCDPIRFGMKPADRGESVTYLNMGPNHPGTHGIIRLVLQLQGEVVRDVVPEIGFHHRGAEKMGERQSWHSYIPYTDRVDYLSGVLNNLPYCMAVETLAGIQVPPRALVIRVMMSELFRIISHLLWYGTFIQDLGAITPLFYILEDREEALHIVEAVTGSRMHPSWFRIGGIAQDLPNGWDRMMKDFVRNCDKHLVHYDRMVLKNPLVKARCKGIGAYTASEALQWGVTGPALRACGVEWDLRKNRPYSGYDAFEFDVPIGSHGDCFDRALVRVEEIRQSLSIIKQCIHNMPQGIVTSQGKGTTPPPKQETEVSIETLITHFLGVTWGPVIPQGEVSTTIEGCRGNVTYYLISDGKTMSYRTRIRTPSFAHVQTIPLLCKGHTIADVIAILAAMDYILSDIDR